MNKQFGSYTYGETKTAGGQTVHFTCGTAPGERDKVVAFLAEHVRDIDVPTTGRVNISHGGYGRYTRYDVVQHEYAGYSHGYIEVLEVKNPPDERNGFIIHDFRSHEGAVFAEWDSLEAALAALENFWKASSRQQAVWQSLGCQRFVSCGALVPWFYAVGDQELIGDYAFPEGLQDDPVYTTGRKFVVCASKDDAPRIKTCLGTRFLSGDYDTSSGYRKPWHRRMIHWDDGSVTLLESDNDVPSGGWVRPLLGEEMWVTEALAQFQVLLTGKSDRFSIKFVDGTQFVGKIIPAKAPPDLRKAGEYYARVRIKGEEKERQGKLEFVPAPETPDVNAFLRDSFSKKNKEIEILEVRPNTPKGKKWSGVFLGRLKP